MAPNLLNASRFAHRALLAPLPRLQCVPGQCLPAPPRLPGSAGSFATRHPPPAEEPCATTTVSRSFGGRVAVLTLSNPRKRNAVTPGMLAALSSHLESIGTDSSLRAVVLRGESPSFCAGAFLPVLSSLDAGTARTFITSIHRACKLIRTIPLPVLASIDGPCIGAGMELAAACDSRVATRRSNFAMPEVRVGVPSVVEAALLPGLIGWGRTRRLLLTGEVVSAEAVERWGFLDALVEDADGLREEEAKFLEAVLESAPQAVANQKRLLGQWEASFGADEAIEAGIGAFVEAYGTDEPQKYIQKVFFDRKAGKSTRNSLL
ncbi:ClpP/crotonase-like domain-containing protein [Hyaloraphidium curvatum]|nr:ClpP/crotonase-like domain-containing protein [Hyaloraphidium curvatum]